MGHFRNIKDCIYIPSIKYLIKSFETTVFWVVTSCRLVEFYRRFRGSCLHHQGDDAVIAMIMEISSTFETSVNFHCITRCNNQNDIFVFFAVRSSDPTKKPFVFHNGSTLRRKEEGTEMKACTDVRF
jgi:hypothetical protein